MTLRERFGRLDGLKIACLGDGNSVAHSLLEAGAVAGMSASIATPDDCRVVFQQAAALLPSEEAVLETLICEGDS